jgi:RNA polymerase-binding transcription factor DksA
VKREQRQRTINAKGEVDIPQSSIPQQWMDQHRRLVTLRERLLEDSQRLAGETKVAVGIDGTHLADLGTDEFERDLDLSLLAAEQDALFEVEEALRRIGNGTYGICEVTGEPIPQARLRAVPWTRFTAEAALELETGGLILKPHLAELGRVEARPEALSVELEKLESADNEIPGGTVERLAEFVAASDEESLQIEDDFNEDTKRNSQP